MKRKVLSIVLLVAFIMSTAIPAGLAVQINEVMPAGGQGATLVSQGNKIVSQIDESAIDKNKLAGVSLPFIENKGQIEEGNVRFYADTFAGRVFVTDKGLTYALPGGKDTGESWAFEERFAGSEEISSTGVGQSKAQVSSFKGNDKSKWQKGLITYESVSLGELYPNIEVNMKAYGDNVEKLFTVAPGGNPADIAVDFEGINSLAVNEAGELVLKTDLGDVKLTAPVAYQDINGIRKKVEVSYKVEDNTYGFTVGVYDPAYPLLIDPLLASTFLGGSGIDQPVANTDSLALDEAGNIYVTGYSSGSFPVKLGRGSVHAGGNDVFVAKISSDLAKLYAATYIGGSGADAPTSIAFFDGDVYVAGYTAAAGFPVTIGSAKGGNDGFVVRLSGTLAELKGTVMVGGSGAEYLFSMKIRANDGKPEVIVGGYTASANFPTTSGVVQSTKLNGTGTANQGFITILDGSKMDGGGPYTFEDVRIASTYLGGISGTAATSLTELDIFEDGRILAGGYTSSNSYPTTAGAYDTNYASYYDPISETTSFLGSDNFLTILSSDLSFMLASTFVGNSNNSAENLRAVKIYRDSSGNEHIYAAGTAFAANGSYSASFTADDITTGASFQGTSDVFIIKMPGDLSIREALTLLGGTGASAETVNAIEADANGNLYVAGDTSSTDFPVTGQQRNFTTSKEGYITKFDSNLNILASTCLGGAGTNDAIYSLRLDGNGHIYALGYTNSNNYPTTAKALQGIYGGGSYDAYITKLNADNLYASDEDMTAPVWPAEEDLMAEDVTPTGLTLLWPKAEDGGSVEGYLISGKDTEDTDYTVIDSVYGDVTTYNVTTLEILDTANILNKGLVPGHSYIFKVEAVDQSGNWSLPLESQEIELPTSNAPYWEDGAELEADNIQTDSLTLLWPPAKDDGEVARYILYAGSQEITAPEYVYNVQEAVYSYTVTNLIPNTDYTFSVFAEDDDGYRSNPGLTLAERTAAPPDVTAPYWPTGVLSGATAEQIVTSISSSMIRWIPPTDDRGVTQYRIRVYEGMQATGTPLREELIPASELGTEVINGITKKTFEIKGLQRLTKYLFVIQAGDAANNWSEVIRNVSTAQGMELILPDYPTESGEAGGGAGGFNNSFFISANLCTITNGASNPPVTKGTGGDEALAKDNLENASGIPLNPTIRLYFYRNMSAGMPGNAEYIKLYKITAGAEQEVPINVFFLNAANTSSERRYLFLNPVRPLSPGTQYRLYLSRELAPNKGTLKMDYDKSIHFTTASPIIGNITVEPERKNVVIDHTTPSGAVISVPDTISDAIVDVSSFLDIPANGQVTAASIPAMTIESMISALSSTTPVQVQIPAGTSISGIESWPGTVNLPTAKPTNSVLVVPDNGKTASVNAVVEIGYGDTPLTFDKAVRIIFPGMAGKDVGYVRGLDFRKITTVLAEDSQAAGDALPAGGEGKINTGTDLVVWTKHFTQYVIYTQTAGSGSGSDISRPVWPSGAEVISVKTNTTEADVTWTAATDNIGVVGYKIFLDSNSIPATTVGGSTTSVHLAGLPQGQHTISVVAVDGAGNQSIKLTGQLGGETAGFSITKLTALDPDPSNLILQIDLSNGLNEDTLAANLKNITLAKKDTNEKISLGHYEYIKQGDNWSEEEKIRRLKLTYTGLEKDVVYKLTIGSGFTANNGNTLGRSYTWELTSTITGIISESSTPTTNSGSNGGNTSGVGIPVPTNTLNSSYIQLTTEGGIKTVKVKENAVNWDKIDLAKLAGQEKGQVKTVFPAGLLSGSQAIKPVEVYYGPVKITVPVKPLEEAKAQQKGLTLLLNTQEGTLPISGLSNETYTYQSRIIEVKGSFSDGTVLTEELEISFGVDVSKLSERQKQGLGAYLYDEKAQSWQYVGGVLTDHLFTSQIPAAGKIVLLNYDRKFSDLSGHWAAGDVTYLVRKHIVAGQDEDRFVPNASITRAEFAALLAKVLELKPVSGESKFKDVKAGDWYAGVVNAAAENGLILGSNGNFDPNRQITREEMAVLLMKMYEYKGNESTEAEQPASFKDGQSISGWASEAVGQAKELGFISGRNDGTFAPRNSATRAEACTMLVRLLEKVS